VALSNVAYELQRLNRTDEAIRKNQRALQIQRETVGSSHPHVAGTLSNQAEFLLSSRRFEEARENAMQAVAILEGELGIENPDLAIPLMAVGLSDLEMGRAGAAIPTLERALVLCESQRPEHVRTPEVRFALARAIGERDRLSQRALLLAERARATFARDPQAKMQMASVDRWIAARQGGSPLSMR
jgi:eukaryotic-like serine/threonine-protein kinase